jgi:hypothetical protein
MGCELSACWRAWWLLTMTNEDFDFRFNRDLLELEWTSAKSREVRDPEQQLEIQWKQGLLTRAEYEERRQHLRGHPKGH